MTGFVSEVSEGGLCLCSYLWKNQETVLSLIYSEVSKLVMNGTGEVVKCHLYRGKELKPKNDG